MLAVEDSSAMSGAKGGMEERVKLRLAFGGRFQQNPESMTYKYFGGEFYNESLPASAKYADFMFKLSEKLKTAVSVRYLSPGEELDPEALITVSDDDDLQELVDEYFAHLHRPGTPCKTFRIRVFAFPATEEPLTPDEIMDGDSFFGVVDHPIRRLQLQRGSSLDYSSWCSTPSSMGSPSVRLASDAEAEYFTSRNGSHAPPLEATHHSAHSMYGGSAQQHTHGPQPQLSPLDSDMERQALEHFRASVNNPTFYGGWTGNQHGYNHAHAHAHGGAGSALSRQWQRRQGQLEWQGGQQELEQHELEQHELDQLEFEQHEFEQQGLDEDEVEELCCYALSDQHGNAVDSAVDDKDSCYQEAGALDRLGCTAAKGSCDVDGWCAGEGCEVDEEGYVLQQEGQQQQEQKGKQQQQQRRLVLQQQELVAPLTPPQPEGHDSGSQIWDRGLPADPFDMTQGHQAPTSPIAATQQLPAHIAAYGAAAQAGATSTTSGGALNLPSHISAFGDEIDEDQQAAATALAGAVTPLQHAARPSGGCAPRTQEFAGLNGSSPGADASPAAHDTAAAMEDGAAFEDHSPCFTAQGLLAADGSPAASAGIAGNGAAPLNFVFAEGVVNAQNAPAHTANADAFNALDAKALAVNGGRRRGPSRSDSGDSAQSLPHIRAVHKVPRAAVKVLRKIGEGAFGEVSVAAAPLYGTVAIKWLKSERFSKHSQSFWREAGLLAELNHPNVLRFYGVVTDDGLDAPVIGIITEYVRGGSLAQFLRAARAPLPLWVRAEMALHAANGMAYLHELSVVHFDLKPDNLLLEGGSVLPLTPSTSGADGGGHEGEGYGGFGANGYAGSSHGGAGGSRGSSSVVAGGNGNGGYSHHRGVSDSGSSGMFGPPSPATIDGCGAAPVVKVADFGLSKHKLNSYVSSCRDLRGTLPYMAPELVADPERVSEKADVWSLGVVMWEMLTRQVPYAELTPQQILLGLMCGNLHLDVPVWCEPEWRGLLEACMEPNPSSRPSMKDLARQLEAIRDQQQALAAEQVAGLRQQALVQQQAHRPQVLQVQ